MASDVTILLLRLAFLAVLYVFLFQLLIIMWRDLRAPAPPVQQAPAGPALDVLAPAATGKLIGEALSLAAVTSLGRGVQNTIVLADPSVSTEHALVTYRLGQWWIEDLGSTNGTHLNDTLVDQPTVIHTGDILRLGSVQVRVRL